MSRFILSMLLIGTLCSGCGILHFKRSVPAKEEPTDPQSTQHVPKCIGRIASVNLSQKFVLIQSPQAWDASPGSIVTTRGDGDRCANLLVTGERMGSYAAADIQSGDVAVGDPVYVPLPPPTGSNPSKSVQVTDP